MKITCLDLLPPVFWNDRLPAYEPLLIFKLLQFVIQNMIESQSNPIMFNTTWHSEIPVVNLLLEKTHSLKSDLEKKYLIAYLQDKKNHLHEKKSLFLESTSTNLFDFLKKEELIIVINQIDYYLFITYFLSHFFNNEQLDLNALMKKSGVTKKQATILSNYYQAQLPILIEKIIVQVSVDINKIKQSEKSLQKAKKKAIEADRAKTEFLENMRHDIRTPLTGIIGFSRLIQSHATDQVTKDYADHLVLASTALLDFQNDILEAIKMTYDPHQVDHTVFSLSELLERVLNLVRPKAITKKIAIIVNQDPLLPTMVIGDAKRLFRIFLELITNALKFTHEGRIEIRLFPEKNKKKEKKYVTLACEIADTGIGIPEDQQESIFIRFYRLFPASDGVYEGSGMGLTIVKKYIKDLHGKIQVKSTPNVGSTFCFQIPLEISDQIEIKKIDPVVATALPSRVQLLLIEDHPMTAKVTRLMLSDIGCDVDNAMNYADAIDHLSKKTYDLIFLDLGLPDGNGFMLAKKIREMHLSVPIIALTAHRESENDTLCYSAGMNGVLEKPLSQTEAITLIMQHVFNKQSSQVIDLKLGAQRIQKNEADAKTMLQLLVQHLSQDEQDFQLALSQNNIMSLRDINHRLLGALVYCGAPQLEQACLQLQQTLKNGQMTSCHSQVRQVLTEISALKNAMQ